MKKETPSGTENEPIFYNVGKPARSLLLLLMKSGINKYSKQHKLRVEITKIPYCFNFALQCLCESKLTNCIVTFVVM